MLWLPCCHSYNIIKPVWTFPRLCFFFFFLVRLAGLVSEPPGQVEEAGEVLGSQQRDGRVRSVRRHGAPLHPAARVHPQVCQGRHLRLLRSLVTG